MNQQKINTEDLKRVVGGRLLRTRWDQILASPAKLSSETPVTSASPASPA